MNKDNKPTLAYSSLAFSLLIHAVVLITYQKKTIHQKTVYSKVLKTRITLKTSNHRFSKKQRRTKHVLINPAMAKSSKITHKIQKQTKVTPKTSTIQERTIVTPVVQTSGSKDLVAQYLSKVRQSILKNKLYPRVARKLKQQGEVVVTFAIRWPNIIEDVKLIKVTPHALLNESAFESVSGLTELAQMPEALKTQTLLVKLPLVYKGL